MASSSSISLSSTFSWKYDVFLSFRGEDTRNNFTDHLYTALRGKGIFTFRDEERLERGEEIQSSLFEAIEESKFAIVILSKRYADSKWCLEELAKIMDCQEKKRQTVLPIFYGVTPSQVRKQTEDFGHEEASKDNKEKVEKWRLALKKVGDLAGWDVAGRSETQVVANIIDFISSRQEPASSTFFEGLVGMDHRLKELKDYLTVARDDEVNLIGIHGMGGIGKTTIARVLFHMFKSLYEGSSFLANVREVAKGNKGLVHLQKQLLSEILKEKDLVVWDDSQGADWIKSRVSCKKVFLVLDDVDEIEQLQKLSGKHGWFSRGSVVIITTRDESLLKSHGVDFIHEVGGLDYEDCRKLLLLKALKKTSHTDEYSMLVNDVISYANGLPLAIDILGSHLCDGGIEKWKGVLDRLKEIPDRRIVKTLQISYAGLETTDKKLFLDIACFFKGKHKNRVLDISNKCRFSINYGIQILKEKSLIKIFGDILWMHDLVQEMGWNIVREQHPNDPAEWSRLWTFKDFYHLATKNTATKKVEGIMVDVPEEEEALSLNGEIFSSMENLRLLKISNISFVKSLISLSNDLRVLEWHGYPLKFLPSTFKANNLVELKMRHSNMEYLWKDIKRCKWLKTISLCHSCNLTETPDFTGIPNLEHLYLEGCTRLNKVHGSVGSLAKLIVLNLKNCKSLVSLPSRVSGMKSLKTLNLNGCSKLKKLPYDMGELGCLEELDLGKSTIKEWPSFVVALWKLNLPNSGILMSKRKLELPPLASFQYLKRLNISGWNLEVLPNSLGSLSFLQELNLSKNNFVSLPTTMSQLDNLEVVSLRHCKKLQSLAGLPSSVFSDGILARGCTSLSTFGDISFLKLGRWRKKYKDPRYGLDFRNCVMMLKNQSRTYDWIGMWLRQWIQAGLKGLYFKRVHFTNTRGPLKPFIRRMFRIFVPGNDIPRWINMWKDDASFIIRLPPYGDDDNFLGFIFCAIVQPNKISGSQREGFIKFMLNAESYGSTRRCDANSGLICSRMTCSHLILHFSGFRKHMPDKALYEETYARFTCETDERLTLKKCGIRLVFREDLENAEVSNNIGTIYDQEDIVVNLPALETDGWQEYDWSL